MLEVKNLSCGIVKDASFTLPRQKCIAFFGPSGSGKTTLLNALAGNRPCTGSILFQGKNIETFKPWKRPFRYLNQRLYLFPYLTIEGNLHLAQFGAGMRNDASQRAAILSQMQIAHLATAYPSQVSGGEQQRAALARAIIGSPKILLLDEPFSSLDWHIRETLWDVLAELRTNFTLSILLVTHEPREADVLADTVLHMDNGHIGLK